MSRSFLSQSRVNCNLPNRPPRPTVCPVQMLEFTGGNKSKAARLLGVSPQAVQKFLESQEAQKA